MSQKHEIVRIGPPNRISYATGFAVKMSDEFGISLDPKDHADPKCQACLGRGTVVFVVHGEEEGDRKRVACGCWKKRYTKVRQIIADQALAAPSPVRSEP